MKLKHTEGPWFYDDGLMVHNNNYTDSHPFGQDICVMFVDNIKDKESIEKAEADARLISCAPGFIEDKIKDYKEIGKWLSAALEDDNVCIEMKQDIIMWFKRFDTFEKATGLKIEEVVGWNK